MAITNISPYLNFSGMAESAIELYTSALGAHVDQVLHYKDVSPEDEHLVMHSSLQIGGRFLRVSDNSPRAARSAAPAKPPAGEIHVGLDFDDAADLVARFDALVAAGGRVTFPLNETFWTEKFGMVTDRFGIRWRFNCDRKRT